jgi:pyrroloquinoline-quinone synthase
MPTEPPPLGKPNLLWATVAIEESLWRGVEVVEAAYDFERHPYLVWMRDEATTRDAFRQTQTPFRFAVEAFSQSLAGVLARMPRLEDRLRVAENIAEEHGHGNQVMSHKYTFLQYLRAMGADQEELDWPCPIWVTAFNHSLRNLCLAQNYEVGAAALGMIEHLYARISGAIASAVNDRGWAAPGSQQHYAVHEELDIEHARELLEVAEPAWDTPRTRAYVALGLLLGAYYFWALYEDLLLGRS